MWCIIGSTVKFWERKNYTQFQLLCHSCSTDGGAPGATKCKNKRIILTDSLWPCLKFQQQYSQNVTTWLWITFTKSKASALCLPFRVSRKSKEWHFIEVGDNSSECMNPFDSLKSRVCERCLPKWNDPLQCFHDWEKERQRLGIQSHKIKLLNLHC